MVDLDSYFARTGYGGRRTPSLETLSDLVHAHVRSIPFENLDVLRGVPILLDPPALEAKLVGARRGGYCFEQNGLLLEVLGQLGFTASPLSARVLSGRPRDVTPARTHLCVRVELDEPWLVDVGFGSNSLTAALRLADEGAQATPHETRRLARDGGRVYNQALLGGEWVDLYVMTLEEMPFIDRVVGNWYTSTHPDSHFKHNLIVSRALPGGERMSILNRQLTHRHRDGSSDTRTLATHDDLLGALREHFGVELPAGTVLSVPAS